MDPHQPSRRARQFSCWRGIFAHARYGLVPLILSCTAPAGSAQAATFNVTNTADSGAGSLRQAIFDANAAGGTNTIDVQNGLGTITLTSGDLNALNSNITLNGNGNTLSGNNAFRGLFVYSGTVAINDLTIENAVASGGDAGQAAGGGAGLGGALFVKDGANVTISNLVAQNNAATGGDGGAQTASGVTGGGGGMGGMARTLSAVWGGVNWPRPFHVARNQPRCKNSTISFTSAFSPSGPVTLRTAYPALCKIHSSGLRSSPSSSS